jgi:transcriptional regulator with XRE-family HTH domain
MPRKALPKKKTDARRVDIGAAVKQYRTERKISTTQLAAKVGLSQAQISRLENNRQGFRSGTLIDIARAIRVKPWVLFMSQAERETFVSQGLDTFIKSGY